MNAQINVSELHTAIAAACFNAALLGKETNQTKSSIGQLVSDLYRSIPAGDKAACEAEFGNGLKGKECKLGKLQEDMQKAANLLAVEWLAAQKKSVKGSKESKALQFKHLEGAAAELAKLASKQLNQRRFECREAFKLGLVVGESETVQVALSKAKAESKKKGADNTPKAPSASVVISDDATMDQIADAVSIWVSKHGKAAAGLATALADSLPITVKRSKAV